MSEAREPLAGRGRSAARALRELVAGVVAEFECAEVALHEIADGERFAAIAENVVQHGCEQDDAEAQAGIDEEQFVEFEAEHAATFAPLARGRRRPTRW